MTILVVAKFRNPNSILWKVGPTYIYVISNTVHNWLTEYVITWKKAEYIQIP